MNGMEKVLKGLECCCQMNGNVCRTECPYSDECIENECVGTAHLCANALELLREQPEQKHGHWKGFTQSRYYGKDDYGEPIFRDGRFYICSECRRKSIIKYPYCPRCGAKMEEEVTQDETD